MTQGLLPHRTNQDSETWFDSDSSTTTATAKPVTTTTTTASSTSTTGQKERKRGRPRLRPIEPPSGDASGESVGGSESEAGGDEEKETMERSGRKKENSPDIIDTRGVTKTKTRRSRKSQLKCF